MTLMNKCYKCTVENCLYCWERNTSYCLNCDLGYIAEKG